MTPFGTIIDAVSVAVLTGMTASLARRLRLAIDTRPVGHVPGAAAACEPEAVHAQVRQDRALPWRLAHAWLARFALAPFRRRPGFGATRVLITDHGPGGLVSAIANAAPRDATIVAIDPNAGMGTLARMQASLLGTHGRHLRVAWVHAHSEALPTASGAFDLIVSAGAMHAWERPEAAMREIRRSVAADPADGAGNGGRVVIADVRRDLPAWAWIVVKAGQRLFAPASLRKIDEPSTSIRAAYRAPEVEWFAARARFPRFRIVEGPAWLLVEAGVTEADAEGRRGDRPAS